MQVYKTCRFGCDVIADVMLIPLMGTGTVAFVCVKLSSITIKWVIVTLPVLMLI